MFRVMTISTLILTLATACEFPENGPSDAAGDDPSTTTPADVEPDDVATPGGNNGDATPAAPPVSDAMFELGQALAFDPILSGNRDIACLSCHHPDVGTDDDLTLPEGVDEAIIPRNAPALFNLHAQRAMFWDNRVRMQQGELITPAGDALTPEMEVVFDYGIISAQAMFPVTSREEMRGEPGDNELADLDDDDFEGIWEGLMVRLRANEVYVDLLEEAYPGTLAEEMTFAHAANAIAGFEIAAFESRNSPYERFLRGDANAMTAQQQAGRQAFNQAGCDQCHEGVGLSDFEVHNTGLAQIGPGKGHGPTGLEDRGAGGYAFRTPTLTNTTLTGPWGHAGQFSNLTRFVAHYQNPEQSLLTYDIEREVEDPFFWDQRFTGSDDAILDSIDPQTSNGGGNGGNGGGPGNNGGGGNNRGGGNNGGGGGNNGGGNNGGGNPAADILPFLQALEDPDILDLGWTVPDSVPSGLPVAP